MAYRAGFENQCARQSTGGSNPPLSGLFYSGQSLPLQMDDGTGICKHGDVVDRFSLYFLKPSAFTSERIGLVKWRTIILTL